jgi:hypothetical protein
MATHAELAGHLLRSAAEFFRHVGQQNPDLQAQMDENARTYESVAEMVVTDPQGEVELPEEGGGGAQ